MNNSEIVIVAAKRTAIGKFGGSLSTIKSTKLGSLVIENILKDLNIDRNIVDEVIMGQVLTANVGQNPARQAALGANLPVSVKAFGVNQVCGSGLKSIELATQSLLLGKSSFVIAGGQENMSLAPHMLPTMRSGVKFGNVTIVDSTIADGLTDVYNQYHMGITAENIASKYNITRESQDRFALDSQNKAQAAISSGKFKDEIVPIAVGPNGATLFDTDEFPRFGSTYDALAKLKPAFKADGSVTAGNSSGMNDGACAIAITTKELALQLDLPVLATIVGFENIGLEPELMGMGPLYSTQTLLNKYHINIKDVDLFELNEAFAAQSLAVIGQLNIDNSKVNVNGGAIALGHPIGASGCRIVVSMLHEMKRRQARIAVAALCIGGGMGISMLIKSNGG